MTSELPHLAADLDSFADELTVNDLDEILRVSWDRAAALRKSAELIRTNYRWLSIQRKIPLFFFDFDVIAGLLPERKARPKKYEASASLLLTNSNKNARESWTCGPLIGPHTLALITDALPDFTLPPGALGELFGWLDRTETNLAATTLNFIHVLRQAKDDSDPSRVLISNFRGESAFACLNAEIERISHYTRSVGAVRSILEKQTPFDHLLGDRPSEGRNDFIRVKTIIDQGRPSPLREKNNFCDAVNATVLAWANSQTPIKKRPEYAFFLASNTPVVNSLRHHQHSIGLPSQDDVTLFVDLDFMVLASCFSELTFGSGDGIVSEAALLSREMGALDGTLAKAHRFLIELISNSTNTEGLVRHFFDSTVWDVLRNRVIDVQRKWGSLLSECTSRLSADHAERNIDAFLRRDCMATVSAIAGSQPLGTVTSELHQSLLRICFDNQLLRELVIFGKQTVQSPRQLLPRSLQVTALSSEAYIGQPLCETGQGSFATISELSRAISGQEVRLVIHSVVGDSGALAAVDCQLFFGDADLQLQAVWCHDGEIATLLQSMHDVLLACVNASQLRWTVSSSFKSYTIDGDLQTGARFVADCCEIDQTVYFLTIWSATARCWCDLRAYENAEFQTGFATSRQCWTSNLIQFISKAIARVPRNAAMISGNIRYAEMEVAAAITTAIEMTHQAVCLEV